MIVLRAAIPNKVTRPTRALNIKEGAVYVVAADLHRPAFFHANEAKLEAGLRQHEQRATGLGAAVGIDRVRSISASNGVSSSVLPRLWLVRQISTR